MIDKIVSLVKKNFMIWKKGFTREKFRRIVVITSQDSHQYFSFRRETSLPLPLLEASINHKYLNEASARNKRGRNKKNDPPRSIF